MKYLLTDTHTHLYSEQFDEDRAQIVQNAINQGVERFFLPAIDASYTQKMYELERQFPKNMFLMTGLHPTSVNENYRQELAHVEEQLSQRKFYAIGETGIDLFWDKTFLPQQQDAFKTQIRWAKKYNLPVVIHCRDAFDEIFEVLEAEKSDDLRGIFHCFTGTLAQAQTAISYQMLLGIGGVVTFKNGKIDQFLNEIPLENIVLETDSPYLAPVPYRGKRNESSYLTLIANKLAEIYQTDIPTIAQKTSQNASKIFQLME